MLKFKTFCFFVLITISGCSPGKKKDISSSPRDMMTLIPKIDKWMHDNKNDSPATWLGMRYHGKTLYEPINLIIIDTISRSAKASEDLIKHRFANAGFDTRQGHSANYKSKMDDQYFDQFPKLGSNEAFSNYIWSFTNDHARLFGPYQKDSIYFWTGAASRELGLAHNYLTFKGAVNEIKTQLVKFSSVKSLGQYNLNNTQNNTSDTTGDHDGKAEVLQIK